MLGLALLALSGCTEFEPATGSPIPTPSVVGVDLGGSGRIPQIAALAGEGEGYGRREPNPSPAVHAAMSGMSHESVDHGSMPGMSHASMDHGSMTSMSHGSTPGMEHGSMSGMQMEHGSTGDMSHRSMPGMRMGHGAMSKMGHGSQPEIASAHGSMSGTEHSKGYQMQMAHSGHAHVQGSGTVNAVDAAAHKVNVSHGPIPAVGFPAMTMDFAVAPSVDLNAVKPGARIKFDMEKGQDGMYVIQSIAPAGGER